MAPAESKKWLNLNDVHGLLARAYVATDSGDLWTRAQCQVWMIASGQRRGGELVVDRNTVAKAFPEVDRQILSIADATRMGQYLYAVEIVGVGVKFGYTRNPKNRLTNHVKSAANHAREVGRIWLSADHDGALANEAALKAEHGGREYLHGADFDVVVAALKSLNGVGEGISLTMANIGDI